MFSINKIRPMHIHSVPLCAEGETLISENLNSLTAMMEMASLDHDELSTRAKSTPSSKGVLALRYSYAQYVEFFECLENAKTKRAQLEKAEVIAKYMQIVVNEGKYLGDDGLWITGDGGVVGHKP